MSLRYNKDLCLNDPDQLNLEGNKYMTRVDTSGSNIDNASMINQRQNNHIPQVMVHKLGKVS